jgi:hypothetical protein
MNKIVKQLAKSGNYSGNIMKAAAKIYRKSHKSSRSASRRMAFEEVGFEQYEP